MQPIGNIERSHVNGEQPAINHESTQQPDSVHRLIGDVLGDSDRCGTDLPVAEEQHEHYRSHEQQLYDCLSGRRRCRFV